MTEPNIDLIMRQRLSTDVYKETPQGTLSLHRNLPPDWSADDKRPAIVFFFGGGWSGGSISQFARHAIYFANRGLVTVRAEYRIKKVHGTTPVDSVEDARTAVRTVRATASEWGVDPDRIITSGGSAGGHIAACCALEQAADAADDPDCSACPNLLALFNPVLDVTVESGKLAERFADVSDPDAVRRCLSPVHQLRADWPPTVLFYGDEDHYMPPAPRFIERARELGVRADLHIAPGQKHGFFNRAPWAEATTKLMDDFLVEHNYLTGPARLCPPEGTAMECESST